MKYIERKSSRLFLVLNRVYVMWDSVYRFLFNPDHEMPSPEVIMLLVILTVILMFLRMHVERKRSAGDDNTRGKGSADSSKLKNTKNVTNAGKSTDSKKNSNKSNKKK